MMRVWILTLIFSGGVHHYPDNGVYASRQKCETVVAVMKASQPYDELVQLHTFCRELVVQK